MKSIASLYRKYPLICLFATAILLYLPSLWFGITRLDDFLFIERAAGYNCVTPTLLSPFQRGVFGTWDNYYRPLFMLSMIVSHKLFGSTISAYHAVNIVLHAVNVALLYRLLVQSYFSQAWSLTISLLFAVHPVLCQAVAWVPGRNDELLALFFFLFFIHSIKYYNTGNVKSLLLSGLWLCLSLLTKETAIVFPTIMWIWVWLIMEQRINITRGGLMKVCWIGFGAIWYALRMQANLRPLKQAWRIYVTDGIHRLPILLQYLGKIFFPVNLSVFPSQKDMPLYWGIMALVLLIVGFVLNKQRNTKRILGGLLLYFILLVPALIIPRYMSIQIFEHRLYLPIIGIFIAGSECITTNSLNISKLKLLIASIAFIILVSKNIYHQFSFYNATYFWEQAVATNPHSAHTRVMLSLQLDDSVRQYRLLQEAIQLDSNEKYINLNLSRVALKLHKIAEAQQYVDKEKRLTAHFRCNFVQAKLCLAQGDTLQAIAYMRTFIENNPAYNNHEGNPNAFKKEKLLAVIDTNNLSESARKIAQLSEWE